MVAMTTAPTVAPGWLRALISFVLIFVAVLITPNAVIASWLKAQVTDTDRFVEMTTSALQDPAVEDYISKQVSALIIEELDIDTLTSELFDGLGGVLPLGDRAAGALALLEKPLANGAKSLIGDVTDRVITSDAFDSVTEQVLTVTHRQIMSLLSGDTSGAIVADDQGVIGIQVGPIIEAVKGELISQGVTLAERIPNVEATIEIGQVDGLVQARVAYSALDTAGYWLPIVVLIMLILGVLAARQRARAALWAGVGVAATSAALLTGISIGKFAFLATVTPQVIPGNAATVIFAALTDRLNGLVTATLIIGVLIAIVSYLVGPFRGAVVIRSAVTDTAGRVRDIASKNGITTGQFGVFVEKAHGWIIGVILAVTGITLFLLRPFTVSGAIWAAIIALVLILLVQLVRQPNADANTVKADENESATEEKTKAESAT